MRGSFFFPVGCTGFKCSPFLIGHVKLEEASTQLFTAQQGNSTASDLAVTRPVCTITGDVDFLFE
jgi:hypothetical protein